MSPWLATSAFYAAATLYGLAGATLLAHLAGAKRAIPVAWGLRFLSGAAVFHGAFEALRWIGGAGPFAGIRDSLSTLALLVVLAFLGVRRVRQRVEVVGAFVAPLTLLMLLASRAPSERPEGQIGGALLALHVGSVLVGTAAFTVAFAMALSYLLQERQVKRKRLSGLFQRLPPLDVLDDLGYRCVAVGLPALTLGIVTGLFVGVRTSTGGPLAAWQQYVGMGAWILFASVLVLRLAAGWRGRRAAIGTILGYASAVLVLVGYYLRVGRP